MSARFRALLQTTLSEGTSGLVVLDPVDAERLAELALWSATSDGSLDADEIVEIASLLRSMPGLEHVDVAWAEATVTAMAHNHPTEERIAARIGALAEAMHSSTLRDAAFLIAVWAAARNGHFSEHETDFLEALQDALAIDDDHASKLRREVINASLG